MFSDEQFRIEFTAEQLRERYADFKKSLEIELEKKRNKERALCKPFLRQLISEFNRKAENAYEETFVVLDETPIPTNLKLERLLELVDNMFSVKGFMAEQTVIGGRSYIKISWEN